jgi:hypothetical protein
MTSQSGHHTKGKLAMFTSTRFRARRRRVLAAWMLLVVAGIVAVSLLSRHSSASMSMPSDPGMSMPSDPGMSMPGLAPASGVGGRR